MKCCQATRLRISFSELANFALSAFVLLPFWLITIDKLPRRPAEQTPEPLDALRTPTAVDCKWSRTGCWLRWLPERRSSPQGGNIFARKWRFSLSAAAAAASATLPQPKPGLSAVATHVFQFVWLGNLFNYKHLKVCGTCSTAYTNCLLLLPFSTSYCPFSFSS